MTWPKLDAMLRKFLTIALLGIFMVGFYVASASAADIRPANFAQNDDAGQSGKQVDARVDIPFTSSQRELGPTAPSIFSPETIVQVSLESSCGSFVAPIFHIDTLAQTHTLRI